MHLIMFYFFAGGVLLTALFLVTTRKPVNAAISLVGTMLCLAGLFVLQDAHLMAVLMIIVYAGAIVVLMLFVIMLLNIGEKEGRKQIGKLRPLKQFFGICLAGLLFIKIGTLFDAGFPSGVNPSDFGTVKAVGRLLFTRFLLQFEMASLLLLAAIVGAVVLAKKRKRSD
jgi:NADH-quinone oxidoreductase subunit J